MTREQIARKVTEAAAAQVDMKPQDVVPAHRFFEDLGYDSLDIVELTMVLEEEFELSIPDEDADQLRSVEQVIDYIESALTRARAA